MDFLDIFNDDNEESIKTEYKSCEFNNDRKRKLDEFLTSCDDIAEYIPEKAPKLDNILFTTPADNISHKIIATKNCKHEVFYPKSIAYKPLKPNQKLPMKEFPFTLDPFQSQAIQCIENNQSVLVSAHTSAGKTVCASYAIALCIKEKRRVIYTTPIKALSNQKYREFKEEFKDVGLLTGDVTIDANASLLIMTTEILLLMIYRNSSIIKEVGWVIYDEVHYMRDKHRGIVWEQSIILMPPEIRMVFLSATIPNSAEFGQWIAHIRSQPCNVVHTNHRPTPLQHYIYPNGADRTYLVVNDKGVFLEQNFQEAMSVIRKAGDSARSDTASMGRKGGSTTHGTHCEKLIKKVFELKNDPAIVFSFSKRSCETFSRLFGKLNAANVNVKENIELIFQNARNTLPEEDRQMHQLNKMLSLVNRGIGIHHSGLLPVLKEIVEILFCEGLTKCLYATETFSMGLNMPAKTVIFTDALKFDGDDKRLLKSGEYIQMAGRAGRRGLDSTGNVILMLDRTINSDDAKKIIMGDTEPLNSSFHLTYTMILNMVRTGSVTPEFLMERSFLQFQTYSELPTLRQQLDATKIELSQIDISKEEMALISAFNRLRTGIDLVNEQMWTVLRREKRFKSLIVPGRLAHVKCQDRDFGWCVIMSKMGNVNGCVQYAECLVPVTRESLAAKELTSALPPPKHVTKPDAMLLNVELDHFLELSSVVVQKAEDVLSSLRTNEDARKEYLDKRNSVIARFNEIPLLEPKEVQCKPKMLLEFEQKLKELRAQLANSGPQTADRMNLFHRKADLEASVERLTAEITKKASIINMDELKSRRRVLRRLGFLSESDMLTTKGRVACEISTGDPLMLTEAMLAGSLSAMTTEQLVGYLSCFVFEEDVKEAVVPREDMTEHFDKMRELARHISSVSRDCRLTVLPYSDEEAYVATFRTGLVEIVRLWANGANFNELNGNSAIFDGSIIRCIRRLDELLGQLTEAARVIGNLDLEHKFCAASKLIKRGIIFAPSLYLATGNSDQ